MGLDPFFLQAQLFCKYRENNTCSVEDTVTLWQHNLFLATKRDNKINNDSCQQALNCSLNPSPSERRITVIVLPHVKQIFLQSYRYSKTTSEHALLLHSAKEHPPSTLRQGTGTWQKTYSMPGGAPCVCSPKPPGFLCTIYRYKPLPAGVRTKKKIIFTLKGKPNSYLLGKMAVLAVLPVHC